MLLRVVGTRVTLGSLFWDLQLVHIGLRIACSDFGLILRLETYQRLDCSDMSLRLETYRRLDCTDVGLVLRLETYGRLDHSDMSLRLATYRRLDCTDVGLGLRLETYGRLDCTDSRHRPRLETCTYSLRFCL